MLLIHFSPRTVILQKANALVPRQGCWPLFHGGSIRRAECLRSIGEVNWGLVVYRAVKFGARFNLIFKLASSTSIVKVREKLLVEVLFAAFRGTLRKNETEKALWKTDNVASAVH
jgi:hypothetical protein